MGSASTIRLDKAPFTLQNLPFGVISSNSNPKLRCAVAIDEYALDLSEYWSGTQWDGIPSAPELANIFQEPSLNKFAGLDMKVRSAVRAHLVDALAKNMVPDPCLIHKSEFKNHLPMQTRGFVDFFCSLEHYQHCAAMVGSGVSPNFYHAPLCYNGRASSIRASPAPVRRPTGTSWEDVEGGKVRFGPSKEMDFELEMGYFVSKPVPPGESLTVDNAPEHIFGFVLLNDWSARDLQVFEMKPLGPIHSKGFGTSISPWIVTLDALNPFACMPEHDHRSTVLDHLLFEKNDKATFNIELSVTLIRNEKQYMITRSKLPGLYWTPFQQLTHLSSSGCGLETGDLMGTGTISGKTRDSFGCLVEHSLGGTQAIDLGDGTQLTYLEDGDEVVLDAWCSVPGGSEIAFGFGECRGILLEAMGGQVSGKK